ncbi:Protein of unknown function DUF2079, membrane [Thalassoporum mexicanum PCC 7367]|uniref:DUF2079 domain-containing protein n=1 Tax=Thalassoporum mexicanum TaxID=3457544 RepID=UPI00029F9ED9|nr:DUF2079 domain-containing protein [Pseudanabaena sp. PCC 7367]AFY71426.1 Protein of unknown function DUF2079, membrane [Pseudanabaena sp. PCC 7367]
MNKLIHQLTDRYAIYLLTAIAAILFFIASSTRHALFQSGGWDLGIFDQAAYLISRGLEPLSSLTGFHILGDHAAIILYYLGLLYAIYADLHWLLAVQAIALTIAAIPIYELAINAQLNKSAALAIAAIYLLYPAVFNINLFDFHPEVIALPGLCWAILFAKRGQIARFSSTVLLVLSCKAALALTVAAMGIWLLIFERDRFVSKPELSDQLEPKQTNQSISKVEQEINSDRNALLAAACAPEQFSNSNNWQLWQRKQKICGAIAIIDGIIWFIVATQLIIPAIGGENAAIGRHLSRYDYLGGSFTEIFTNLFTKPQLLLGQVFSLDTLGYLALLAAPLIWLISYRQLTPLIAAIPALAMNILASDGAQRDLVHQYSLPVLPFLFLVVIYSWHDRPAYPGLLRSMRHILLWSLLAFAIISRLSFFGSNYLDRLDTWQADHEAIAYVKSRDPIIDMRNYRSEKPSVLTTNEIAPHLTHRRYVRLAITEPMPTDLNQYDFVLLNIKHPGWLSNPEFAADLVARYQDASRSPFADRYRSVFSQDGVYLFERIK